MTVGVLYKYGMLGEHSEALFSTPNVWFASPASLNDPFECRPWFTFEGSERDIVTRLARGLHQQEPHLSPHEAMARAFGIYREGRHRNPETWEGMRAGLLSALADNIGIYCLSATNNSILMWSHYADEHRGYCLGFEAGETTPFFGAAQEVRYSDTYPVVDVFTTTNSDQVDLVFLTKFTGWSYETEYRIIDHEAGPGTHSYPAELLRSVTFGFRMPESDRARIREWVGRRGHAVKFFEAIRDDRQFKIDVREIA